MTAVEGLRSRLEAAGCRLELAGEGLDIAGDTGRLAPELVAEARRIKPALIVELLRENVRVLAAFIDGDTRLAERQARLPEYLETVDRLTAAEQRLFAWWREAGFRTFWSGLVEELILVGEGLPPAGSEAYTVYTWPEVAALKDRSPEDVAQAHRVRKVFRGTVRTAGRAG